MKVANMVLQEEIRLFVEENSEGCYFFSVEKCAGWSGEFW